MDSGVKRHIGQRPARLAACGLCGFAWPRYPHLGYGLLRFESVAFVVMRDGLLR